MIYTDEGHLVSFKDDLELVDEDADAKQERKEIYALPREDYHKYPLVTKDIRKVYASVGSGLPKIANKNISFKVAKGELFGLLGPNGAGKTTLIQQLTGIYPSTSGNAWICGHGLNSDLDLIRLQIGMCPQFDILWEIMTVEEHLLFYARIKGIEPDNENKMVT